MLSARHIVLGAVLVLLCWVQPGLAAVDLQWRPSEESVVVGQPVRLVLWAVASGPADELISAMDVVVLWDPVYLGTASLGAREPIWLTDGFMGGSINDDLADGNVMYSAWAKFSHPVRITQAGLPCVSFQFASLAPTPGTDISIVSSYGMFETKVFDATIPNYDIKGSLGTARIMVVPANHLMSVAEAKQKLDETGMYLAGPIVTRAFASENYFYVEDRNRVAGIRVNCPAGQVPSQGATPTIHGVIRTVDRERVIDADDVNVGLDTIAEDIPPPLAIICRAAWQPLSPQGLLVRISGHARSVGTGSFTLDDGSPAGVPVELHGVSAPGEGDFVLVTGAMGADISGPVLRVNSSGDVQTIPH